MEGADGRRNEYEGNSDETKKKRLSVCLRDGRENKSSSEIELMSRLVFIRLMLWLRVYLRD